MKNISFRSVSAVISVLSLVAIVVTLFFCMNAMSSETGDGQLALVERAVERAAVQCYALEGSYPPNIQYLQDKYGLDIDTKKYFVDYTVLGSNMKPDITVLLNGGGADD